MFHKFLYFCVLTICVTITAGNQTANAEQLWYTIQAGSSVQLKDAERVYDKLAQELPPALNSHLRIEQVSSYFTIRLGKANSKQELHKQLRATEKITQSPITMKAYVLDKRIVKQISTLEPRVSPVVKAPTPPSTKTAKIAQEQLYYTVQAASYNNEKDARIFYVHLTKKLPEPLLNNLRIEKISSFYAVRVGKASDKELVQDLYNEVKNYANASIIKAYIRKKRTVVSYTAKADSSPTETQKDMQSLAPAPAPALKNKVPTTSINKEGKAPAANMPNKNTLPSKLPQTEAPTKKQTDTLPVSPPKETENKALKIDSPEYKNLLITKYLGDQSETTANHEERIARSDKFPETKDCLANGCHVDLMEGEFDHYPTQENKCLACHKQTNPSHPASNGSSFEVTYQGAELCYQCHKKFGTKKITHSPVEEGECIACHNPHSSKNKFLIPVGMEGQEQLCLQCHDDQIVNYKKLHGPVGLGTCTYCHNPHESSQESLLKDSSQELCISCHDAIAKGIEESPYVHSAVTTQGCTSCHDPHGSTYGNLLSLEGERFCFTCHETIEDKYNKSRSKHAALYLQDQCGTCHFPHFSKNRSLLNSREYDLCLSCHSDSNTIRSKSPKNIEQEMRKNYLHKPVADGDCSLCHDPHGSKNAKLLVAAYPGSFYAPYSLDSYALCFTCHDEELLSLNRTDDATNFRNGTQNLHYTHVAIERKGRTCQSCHQSHASDGPKLINQLGSVFGAWTMSIQFSLTTNGGTCTPGCHREMEYDRSSAFDNSVGEDSYGESYIDYESIK